MRNPILLFIFLVPGFVFGAESQLLFENSDFERGSLLNWEAEGAAFEVQPVKGDNIAVRGSGPSQHRGEYWIGTYEKYNDAHGKPGDVRGDTDVGKLTSAEFKVEKPYINFLIGGGSSADTAVWLKVEGKDHLLSAGSDAEAMRPVSVDVSEFMGKHAQIVIVDNVSGGWGHVNADDFVSSDKQVVEAVNPSVLPKDMEGTLMAPEDNAKKEEKSEVDPHRPRYHVVYSGGDPNGCIYFNGKYHMFFIGGMGWLHISSKDLIHWEQHPLAFKTALGAVCSGSMTVNKEGMPTAVTSYWSDSLKAVGGICIATALDKDLIKWKVNPKPVIPIPKKGEPAYEQYSTFDCHAWRDGDEFYLTMGNAQWPGYHLEGPVPFLFKSKDLLDWKYLGRLMDMQKPLDLGWVLPVEDGACSDFFKLGDKYIYKFISHFHGEQYFIGDWKDEQFYPESHRRMNWIGGGYFASETLLTPDNRRIAFAWVMEMRGMSERAHDWHNVVSLPSEMYLSDKDKMLIRPAKELRSLRINERTHQHRYLQPGKPFKPDNIKGASFEMEVVISPMNSDKVGVKVLCSPDMQEYTVIEYDQRKRTLSIDSSKSSLSKKLMRVFPNCYASGSPDERKLFEKTIHRDIPVHTAPLHLEEDDMLKLDIFVDNSIIEVYANNRQMITGRVYPTRADSKEVQLFS